MRVGSRLNGYVVVVKQQRTWHLKRHGIVRADAPGIFVPALDLPGAAIGDLVIVEALDEGHTSARKATIASLADRDGVSYFRLDFESPR